VAQIVPGRRCIGGEPRARDTCDRARDTLKWKPHFNDPQTIVSHALVWERKLSERTTWHC
jgi:UDP-glucose 4-epimerase